MSNNKLNDKQARVKKKKIFAILLFTIAAIFLIGTIAAYYSDFFGTNVDTSSSTLRIGGSYTFFLNDEEVEAASISGLNPGDVIIVRANILNNGNQSAWIREKIDFSSVNPVLLPYLAIYEGEYSQIDFMEELELNEYYIDNGIAVGSNKVINGVGENAQEEIGEEDYFLGESFYTFSITIRFLPTAGNDTQGKLFSFSIITQALQYKNNTNQPTESNWNTVAAAM